MMRMILLMMMMVKMMMMMMMISGATVGVKSGLPGMTPGQACI